MYAVDFSKWSLVRGSTVGVRANGWYRQTVRGHQIDLSLVSSTRCPSLPQRRGRRKKSTSNKDSCKPPQEHHAVKVKYKSTPLAARAPPARPEGTSWASQVLRRTVVTRGGRRCSQTAFSTLEFSFKCRRRRLVGRGHGSTVVVTSLLASTPIKYTNAGPRLMRSAWSNFRPG